MSGAVVVEKAYAKINLTLRVVGRRADGYHDLESLVVFADLADTLTLQPGPISSLDVTGPFARASGDPSANLVLKAQRLLAESIGGVKGGRFLLDKCIPVAAGIGGGSADAAAALRLLARLNGLAADDARLMLAALRAGADVPVCLSSSPCIMTGVGERLSPPLDLPPLHAVLVNPRVPLATHDVFAAYARRPAAGTPLPHEVPRDPSALIAFLRANGNDLTDAAIRRAAVVAEVLDTLRMTPGALLARMSGSGSTCFGLFAAASEAQAAAAHLAAARNEWWVTPAIFGGRS